MSMNNRPNNNGNTQPKKSRRGKSGSKKGRKGRSRKKGERVGGITGEAMVVGRPARFNEEQERIINFALREVLGDMNEQIDIVTGEDSQGQEKTEQRGLKAYLVEVLGDRIIYNAYKDNITQKGEKKIGRYVRTKVQGCCNKITKPENAQMTTTHITDLKD